MHSSRIVIAPSSGQWELIEGSDYNKMYTPSRIFVSPQYFLFCWDRSRKNNQSYFFAKCLTVCAFSRGKRFSGGHQLLKIPSNLAFLFNGLLTFWREARKNMFILQGNNAKHILCWGLSTFNFSGPTNPMEVLLETFHAVLNEAVIIVLYAREI